MMKALTRSYMKYPGSKQLMMPKLLRHLPKAGGILIDAFTGSSSVALNTDYQQYLLNDANADLIALHRLAQREPDALLKEARRLFRPETNNATYYYGVRDSFNACTNEQDRAILLLYLSRHGYNGLCRYNQSGGFNTPFGLFKAPYLPEKEIYHFAEKLEHAEFYSMDFADFINMVVERFRHSPTRPTKYIDPPYLKHDRQTQTFTEYTSAGFKLEQHRSLDAILTENRDQFNEVLVSNHDGKLLRDTYKGAKRVVKFRVTRTISAKTKERKPAPEVLLYY